MFGRQMRDGMPVVPGKYNPRNTWKELLEHREKALARRHVAHHEAWSEHTKKLPPLHTEPSWEPSKVLREDRHCRGNQR